MKKEAFLLYHHVSTVGQNVNLLVHHSSYNKDVRFSWTSENIVCNVCFLTIRCYSTLQSGPLMEHNIENEEAVARQ